MTAIPLFLIFVEFAFANFDCKIRIYMYLIVMLTFIFYSHYKNTSICYYEEYKKSPDPKILRCRDHEPSSEYSWIRQCVGFYFS